MIVDFRDGWLRAFFVDNVRSRNIPPDLSSVRNGFCERWGSSGAEAPG